MRPSWRLLVDGAAAGPRNMAVDETLLATAIAEGVPTLRFYHWNGPWLSLGYRQRLSAERLSGLERAGVGVVRRVTGGRAVLHGEDLTYAVTASETALPGGLAATYALISQVLQQALAELGVDADPVPGAAAAPRTAAFDCFAEPAAEELCVGGRKLVGSAQRRAGGGVLQHGSIRLAPDPPGARRATGLESGVATSLSELGADVSLEALIAACGAAFSRRLGVDLERAELGPGERRRAREREAERAGELPIRIAEAPRGASRVHLDGR